MFCSLLNESYVTKRLTARVSCLAPRDAEKQINMDKQIFGGVFPVFPGWLCAFQVECGAAATAFGSTQEFPHTRTNNCTEWLRHARNKGKRCLPFPSWPIGRQGSGRRAYPTMQVSVIYTGLEFTFSGRGNVVLRWTQEDTKVFSGPGKKMKAPKILNGLLQKIRISLLDSSNVF